MPESGCQGCFGIVLMALLGALLGVLALHASPWVKVDPQFSDLEFVVPWLYAAVVVAGSLLGGLVGMAAMFIASAMYRERRRQRARRLVP